MQFKGLWRYDRFDIKTKTLNILPCVYKLIIFSLAYKYLSFLFIKEACT